MNRHTVHSRADWLRPRRPLTRQPIVRETLLPKVTVPGARDLVLSVILAMVLGALTGVAIILAIVS